MNFFDEKWYIDILNNNFKNELKLAEVGDFSTVMAHGRDGH